jgi:hypothetical protein
MLALDYPYISPYLIQTIEKNTWPVIDTPQSRSLLGANAAVNYISPTEAAAAASAAAASAASVSNSGTADTVAAAGLDAAAGPALYTNSENALSLLETEDFPPALKQAVTAFKHKVIFRDHLAARYPDFFYQKVNAEDIETIDPETLPYPCILKPAIGFFSLGVRTIPNPAAWRQAAAEISQIAESPPHPYPEAVLDQSVFIIEESIDGDEYAIDAYFDGDGKPVILGIYEHLFSSEADISDRVYITSGAIIDTRLEACTAFLETAGRTAGYPLKHFPIHAEVRISPKYGMIPIEINPLRFGGWCTTPDLSRYAYGFNQYEYFFASRRPNWKAVREGMGDDCFSIIVLDNSTGVPAALIDSFDFPALQARLSRPLEIRPVDFRTFDVFGFVFARTAPDRMDELYYLLQSDLREFIRLEST